MVLRGYQKVYMAFQDVPEGCMGVSEANQRIPGVFRGLRNDSVGLRVVFEWFQEVGGHF